MARKRSQAASEPERVTQPGGQAPGLHNRPEAAGGTRLVHTRVSTLRSLEPGSALEVGVRVVVVGAGFAGLMAA